jgi:hypothetical protein
MKVFLSSTYIDLIEHRKAAHDSVKPIHEWGHEFTNACPYSFIRELFVDGTPSHRKDQS